MGKKVKLSGSTKVKLKKKPVKSGSADRGGNGGILNAKMVAIVKKKKKEQ